MTISAFALRRRSTCGLIKEGEGGEAHLLATATLEGVGLRLLLSCAQGIEEVLRLNLRIRCFPLLRRHLLTRHFAESRYRKVTRDDAFAETRVVLVLEIDEQGTNLGLVGRSRPAVIVEYGFLNVLRSTEDELARYGKSAGEKTKVRYDIAEDVRAPESNTRAS